MIDYALRRRFSFFNMTPGFDSEGFRRRQRDLNDETFDALISCVQELNRAIARDGSLGDGFTIGHSYFCGAEEKDDKEAWMRAVVEYELIPMLSEYWFDDSNALQTWESRLRGVFQ